MSFTAQTVRDRMSSRLDAEGSDHYHDDLDIIPAINSSIHWMVNLVNSILSEKKMSPEVMRELMTSKVWQTNWFSRFSFNSDDVGHNLWTVVSITPKPDVYVPSFSSNDLASYSASFAAFVLPNVDKEFSNSPIIGFDPVDASPLQKPDSVFRPDLVHVRSSERSALRLTHEEWQMALGNPFSAGNKHAKCNVQYAYLDPTDYNTIAGGYVTNGKYEFELRPELKRQLVTMTYVKTPSPVAQLSDVIEFPDTFFEMLVSKALQFVSVKQGDNTNLYTVTGRDIQLLLSSIA